MDAASVFFTCLVTNETKQSLAFLLRNHRYGEDIGTPRTSTKPKLVDALEGLTVMQVAMGYGHSLLLAK